MLEQFENHLTARRRSPATIRIRMTYLRQLAERHDLEAVTLPDLEAVIASHPEWKPATVNAAISTWRVFYKWAKRNRYLELNPAEDMELVYVPREHHDVADDDILRASLTRASDRDRAILLLGRECGLRRTEIATLRIEDRAGRWVTVHGKGGKVRRAYASKPLLAALDKVAGGRVEGYYFEGHRDGHIAPETVYKTVLRLTTTPTHALRRRAITTVYRDSGNDIRLAQEFAGHSSPAITAIYVQIEDDDLKRAGGFATLDGTLVA